MKKEDLKLLIEKVENDIELAEFPFIAIDIYFSLLTDLGFDYYDSNYDNSHLTFSYYFKKNNRKYTLHGNFYNGTVDFYKLNS